MKPNYRPHPFFITYYTQALCLKLQYRLKTLKKVIRDTWQSITYYFAKYHVILGQVSRDTFFAIFFVPIHYFLNLFETAEYPQR